MKRITQKFVDQLNEEVSSENFEDIIDKYELDTPKGYSHVKLCEQDGIEVWGVSEDGELLVYDAYNGFYLLSKHNWIQEVKKVYDEEAVAIFEELGIYEEVPRREFKIYGYEAIEKTAKAANQTSNRVYVPKSWKRVMVVRLE